MNCYPYVTAQINRQEHGIELTVKIHADPAGGVGLMIPEGRIERKLNDVDKVQVMAEAVGQKSTPSIAKRWECGDKQVQETVTIMGQISKDDVLVVSISVNNNDHQPILTGVVAEFCKMALCPKRSLAPKMMQNSFASGDAQNLILESYRDKVKQIEGWTMSKLIGPWISSGWFKEWQGDLDASQGVFVLYGKEYKKSCQQAFRKPFKRVPVLMEAAAILRRKKRNPNFIVIVLDPGQTDQGSNAIYSALQACERTGKI